MKFARYVQPFAMYVCLTFFYKYITRDPGLSRSIINQIHINLVVCRRRSGRKHTCLLRISLCKIYTYLSPSDYRGLKKRINANRADSLATSNLPISSSLQPNDETFVDGRSIYELSVDERSMYEGSEDGKPDHTNLVPLHVRLRG